MKYKCIIFAFFFIISSCVDNNGTLSKSQTKKFQDELSSPETESEDPPPVEPSEPSPSDEDIPSEPSDPNGPTDPGEDNPDDDSSNGGEHGESGDIWTEAGSIPYYRIIDMLGGRIISPELYTDTSEIVSFQDFLNDVGVVPSLSAKKLAKWGTHTKSYMRATARNLPSCESEGVTNLLPPRKFWSRSAAIALFIQKIANINGIDSSRIGVISHFRPACYNQNVPGASKTSDHINSNAADLTFNGTDEEKVKFRETVMRTVCNDFWHLDQYHMGVGFGHTKIHVGFRKSKDSFWSYGSLDVGAQAEFANCRY